MRGRAGRADPRRPEPRGPARPRGDRARDRPVGPRDISARGDRDRGHRGPRGHARGRRCPRGARRLRGPGGVLPGRRAHDGRGGGAQRPRGAGGPPPAAARPRSRRRPLPPPAARDAAAHPAPAVGERAHRHPHSRLRPGPHARAHPARRPSFARNHDAAELGEPSLLHHPPHRGHHSHRGREPDRDRLVDALARADERALPGPARAGRARDLPALPERIPRPHHGAGGARAPSALGRGVAHPAHHRAARACSGSPTRSTTCIRPSPRCWPGSASWPPASG